MNSLVTWYMKSYFVHDSPKETSFSHTIYLFIYFKIGKNNLLLSELCRGSPLVWVLQSPPHLPFFPVTLAPRENHKLEFKKALTIPGLFHRQEESRGFRTEFISFATKTVLEFAVRTNLHDRQQ